MTCEKRWIRALEWKERETSEKVFIARHSAETASMMRSKISDSSIMQVVVMIERSKTMARHDTKHMRDVITHNAHCGAHFLLCK